MVLVELGNNTLETDVEDEVVEKLEEMDELALVDADLEVVVDDEVYAAGDDELKVVEVVDADELVDVDVTEPEFLVDVILELAEAETLELGVVVVDKIELVIRELVTDEL